MDILQYGQIIGIFIGLSAIIKMVYDVKLELSSVKSSVEKYTLTTEFKYEELEKRVEKLEEQRI